MGCNDYFIYRYRNSTAKALAKGTLRGFAMVRLAVAAASPIAAHPWQARSRHRPAPPLLSDL